MLRVVPSFLVVTAAPSCLPLCRRGEAFRMLFRGDQELIGEDIALCAVEDPQEREGVQRSAGVSRRVFEYRDDHLILFFI